MDNSKFFSLKLLIIPTSRLILLYINISVDCLILLALNVPFISNKNNGFDVFIPIQPFPSWKLDYTTYKWVPPIPMPEESEGVMYKWSEINKEWIEVRA